MSFGKKIEGKLHISYNDIHTLVSDLAEKIIDAKFKPDYILAIGGGGFIPARILRTFIDVPIISVTINFYNEDDTINDTPNIVQWIDCESLKDKKILIVDEIDDTRRTLKHLINMLNNEDVRDLGIAVIHNKIKKKELDITYPYFEGEKIDDIWVIYPWDICDKRPLV